MRRSTRRSSMAVSIHQSLEFDCKKVNTRRSSTIIPQFQESQNVVGNFTTKFSMSSFVKKVEELNNDQKSAIEKVGFGNLLRIPQHTLRKNLLVEWMERWDSGKRAFVLHGKELKITAIDAALILGLRATGNPVCLNEEDPLSELEKDYGATSSNRKVSVSTLEQRLQSLGDLANEDFTRTFLLFIFGTILFPSSNAKIDSRYLLFLEDLEGVSDYDWGMAVVEDLFNLLSKRKEEGTKSMEGCLLLLQIWSYEHIDIGRPNLTSPLDFPRACRWESSRCNTPRHWFTTKFNELEESLVNWQLQPTAVESNVDIIRELLAEKAEGEEILLTRTNPKTTFMSLEVSSEILSEKAVLDEEPGGHMVRGKSDEQAHIQEYSRQSSEISSLVEETEGQEVLSTRTRTKMPAEKMGLPPKVRNMRTCQQHKEELDCKHDEQADIQENSRQSSEISSLVEETEGQEVLSTRTRTKMPFVKMGLPPKGSSRYIMEGKERIKDVGRSKLEDVEADIQEDSRQSTDASVLTEDFTECSSSYFLQEDQIVETSHCAKGVSALEAEKSRLDDVAELKKELAMVRSQLSSREEVIANLRKELADLKEDNQHLRALPPADNIERLIDAYFEGNLDASEVELIR